MRKLFLWIFLLLCGIPLHAQWTGSLDLSGGLGGMEGSDVSDNKPMYHGITKGVFQLNYKKGIFSWNSTLNGKWEPKTTDNARISYKEERLGAVYKAAKTQPLTVSWRSDFTWTPEPGRKYSTWIFYQYKNDRAKNHSVNAKGDAEGADSFSYYFELPEMNEHKLETGFKTHRSFDDDRYILQSSLNFKLTGSKKVNTWIVFNTDEEKDAEQVTVEGMTGYARKYRITPNSADLSLDGDIHLQMRALDEAVKLNFAPGIRLCSKQSLDENSGATRINITEIGEEDIWRDSTRLRENFDFLSIWTEPYLTADFQWKQLQAHADYACQAYGRRLNDATHRQPWHFKGVYPVGKGNIKWTFLPGHALNLSNELSVKHPEYLKVCWYDRTAGYMDQLYRGDEQLLSPVKRRYALAYEFQLKRFSASTTLSYTREENEIDQTWNNEEIDGRLYKVFRWINASDSRGFGVTQKLGWEGKIITAGAEFVYNQTQRTSKSSGALKKSYDWRLNTNIAAHLGKGWSIGAEAKYRSKVATFFTIFNEYCTLNAFVKKEFKNLTLYLEGRDLLDQTMETSFESEELKEYWIEQVRDNRRMFVLGLKWNF